MHKILTITFSPCIDKSTTVPELIPEKKLKCGPPKLEPGGGGINVARAIRKLGGEATAVYPAGGYTGQFFNALLEKEKIPAIVIQTENETRENIIVLETNTNRQYRFGMPGAELKAAEWRRCLEEIEKAEGVEFIVASGSLPPGVPPDIFGRIAGIARQKNARLVVDTSGEALQHAAEQGAYLLKPNLGELSALAGRERIEIGEIEKIAREVIRQGRCEVIVVSMGEAGAMLITQSDVFRAVPPAVEKHSTVGAGDSMVAGMVLAISRGRSLSEALRYGVACGTAATMNPGTELCRAEDVENLLKRMAP